MALRMGMAGEIGFELQGPMADYGKEVYNAVVEAGQEFGIRRLGHRTAMINHLEACFPTGHWHFLNNFFDSASRQIAKLPSVRGVKFGKCNKNT